jgi:hypothetical protein
VLVEACLQVLAVWLRHLEQASELRADGHRVEGRDQGKDRRVAGPGRVVAFPSVASFLEQAHLAAEHQGHRVLVRRAYLEVAFPVDVVLPGPVLRQARRPPPACLGEAACRVERLRVDVEA